MTYREPGNRLGLTVCLVTLVGVLAILKSVQAHAFAQNPQITSASLPGSKGSRLPNELGRIPILEYHSIGGVAEFAGGPLYDIHGLNIAPDTLRKQLQQMYDAGWYPINVRDLFTGHLAVPKGKIPVALTFDDARPTQFRYRKDGTIDPDCAVGILEAFHRIHPDWPLRATFYVLPESQWNGVPFDQDGLETQKLRYLVHQGYELGNHTTSHRSLASMSANTLRWEMAECVRYFRAQVPTTTLQTMALPYGIAPKKQALWRCLLQGTQGGTTYRNRCILLAQGAPSFSPYDKRFDSERVMRVVPSPGRIEQWIQHLIPGATIAPFVSDGNPGTVTIPRAESANLAPERLRRARLVTYSDQPGSPAP